MKEKNSEYFKNRKGKIIYYDWKIGGYTLSEWLIRWCWLYIVDEINILELIEKVDFINTEMPGALESEEWNEVSDYLRLKYA